MRIPWPKTLIDYTEWFSTVTGLAGAIIVSSNIGITGWGYIIFIASAISLAWVSWYLKRWGIFTMSVGYTLINAWGIWRWLILPLL